MNFTTKVNVQSATGDWFWFNQLWLLALGGESLIWHMSTKHAQGATCIPGLRPQRGGAGQFLPRSKQSWIFRTPRKISVHIFMLHHFTSNFYRKMEFKVDCSVKHLEIQACTFAILHSVPISLHFNTFLNVLLNFSLDPLAVHWLLRCELLHFYVFYAVFRLFFLVLIVYSRRQRRCC